MNNSALKRQSNTAHNGKQIERAAYLLRKAMEAVMERDDLRGCVQVRIPIRYGKFGEIVIIREEAH